MMAKNKEGKEKRGGGWRASVEGDSKRGLRLSPRKEAYVELFVANDTHGVRGFGIHGCCVIREGP